MKDILLLFHPRGGNVEKSAGMIHGHFPEAQKHSLEGFNVETLRDARLLIVGGSTVGASNWQEATAINIWSILFLDIRRNNISLAGKQVAIFGLGDQVLYPDHFVDGMMILKEEFSKLGADVIGYWPTKGYSFTGSDSVEGDHFVGLALDEDQQDHMTPARIEAWAAQVKKEADI
jgi:flavodoxin I